MSDNSPHFREPVTSKDDSLHGCQRTADRRLLDPAPKMQAVMVWIVDIGASTRDAPLMRPGVQSLVGTIFSGGGAVPLFAMVRFKMSLFLQGNVSLWLGLSTTNVLTRKGLPPEIAAIPYKKYNYNKYMAFYTAVAWFYHSWCSYCGCDNYET